MGDSGEGLVDAEARIQERIEELQRSRELARQPEVEDPEKARKVESFRLARKELSRQLDAATQAARKSQLSAAIADVDRRIAEIENGAV